MRARNLLCVTLLLGMTLTARTPLSTLAAEKPLRGSLYWEKRSDGLAVYSVKTTQKHIAITFDDGPHPEHTKDIIGILEQYHAKATFFVIGQSVAENPQMIRLIVAKGHEVGNHSYSHAKAVQITPTDVQKCDDVITTVTGIKPLLLRPPGGRVSDQTLWVARQTKHRLILWTWDVDTRDWAEPGVQKIVDVVVQHADPGDIVLFHDGGGSRQQTVRALGIILSRLTAEGYQFVTVSQLLREQVKSDG